MDETGVRAGDRIVVIDAGAIGLMFIHLATLMGADVIAVVKRDEQVEIARSFGGKDVIQTLLGTDVIARVRALTTNGHGMDAAIEAVALPETWQWAVEMLRKGGTVNLFGGCAAGTQVRLDTNRLHYNDLTLRASFHHRPSVCPPRIRMDCDRSFANEKIITSRAPLEQLVPVLERMLDRTHEIKTAILPGGVA